MKKTRLITIIICFFYVSFIFPSFFVYAADSQAYKDGYSNGLWEGIDAAYDDLEDVKKKNYSKAMPKDSEIKDYYDLDKETAAYSRDFIRGYKEGFKEGYNNTYDNPKNEIQPTNYEEELGMEMGRAAGFSDYYANKNNRWASAVPGTTRLIDMFGLGKETNAYKNKFITKFKENFQEGYETAYREAKYEPKLYDIERGEQDGEVIGGLLGANYGRKDYYDKKAIKWDRNLPSDNEIIKSFVLNNDVANYQKSFIAAFKKAFQEKYDEAYRNANIEYYKGLFDKGYDSGKALGIAKGTSNAQADYMMARSNDPERFKLTDDIVINEYNLFNEHKRYQDGFIAGFKGGYKSGYTIAYQSLSFSAYSEKVIDELIPMGGGAILAGDSKMQLILDKGIFYNDVVASINKYTQIKNPVSLPSKDSFIKSSDLYQLNIINPYERFDNDKPIMMSFEYYGGIKGGIYRYLYGNWMYVPSSISENMITAYITPRMAQQNALYGVFIDEKAINPLDTRGHWAKDDIITTLRRGFTGLYSDNTYRPDVYLTRAQLLTYLGRANKWKVELPDEFMKAPEKLEDYNDIKGIKGLVAVSMKEGYLEITDNKFKPNEAISYKDLEKVIRKVYKNNGFTWKWVENKMAVIKDKRSSSVDSMNNKITRAEFAYMLNLLNE